MIFGAQKLDCELFFFFILGLVYFFPFILKKQFHDINDRLESSLIDKMKLPTVSEENKCTHNLTKDLIKVHRLHQNLKKN